MYICRPIDVSDQGLLLKPSHPHQRTAGYTLININLSLSLLPTTTLPCVFVNHCYHYEQYDHSPVRAGDQGGEVTGRLALPQQTASPPRRPPGRGPGTPCFRTPYNNHTRPSGRTGESDGESEYQWMLPELTALASELTLAPLAAPAASPPGAEGRRTPAGGHLVRGPGGSRTSRCHCERTLRSKGGDDEEEAAAADRDGSGGRRRGP